MLIQISLVSEIAGFIPNLPFACIIVFASVLSLYETALAGLIFMVLITMFSYNSHVLWIYPLIAILAAKLNPASIDDKFLVCIVYCLLLTPILEIFDPSGSGFIAKTLNTSLGVIFTAIPLFFVVKIFFKTQKSTMFIR